MSLPDRAQAWEIVQEWIQSDSLRKHVLAVEAAVRAYARYFGEDEEFWGVTALLHDLDFERFPDMDDQVNGHPRTALRMFREWGYPDKMIVATITRTVGSNQRPRKGDSTTAALAARPAVHPGPGRRRSASCLPGRCARVPRYRRPIPLRLLQYQTGSRQPRRACPSTSSSPS